VLSSAYSVRESIVYVGMAAISFNSVDGKTSGAEHGITARIGEEFSGIVIIDAGESRPFTKVLNGDRTEGFPLRVGLAVL
jgi:hypothetical protein